MILLIVLLAFILRVTNLNQSLWLDEAINVIYARDNNFLWFISKYPLGDFHPPLYFAILWIWSHIFGSSEISVRLPSVIFGVLTVVVTFLIAKEYSKKIALIAALLLAIAPLHIYYSQEARPYALAAFTVSLSFYFFLKVVKNFKNNIYFYILSSVLVLYSDYVASLALLAQMLYLLLYRRDNLGFFLKAYFIIIAFLSPWFLIFFDQLKNGIVTSKNISGWGDVVGGIEIKEALLLWVKGLIGRISIDNKVIYALVTGIISINYLFLIYKLKDKLKNFEAIFLWLTMPPLLGLLISFFIPIFSYFRFVFVLPAFYLLISLSIINLSKNPQKIFLSLVILIQVIFSFMYLLNPKFQRENWKTAVAYTESLKRENDQNSSSKKIIIFEYNEIPAPYRYYQKSSDHIFPGLAKIPVENINDLNNLEVLVSNIDIVYVYEYLVDITDKNRLLRKKLINLGFKDKSQVNFTGVGLVYIYER